LLSDQERKDFDNLNSTHAKGSSVRNVSQLFRGFGDEAFKNFLKLEAIEGLDFSMVKIGVKNHTVVSASVLVFGHCVVNDFMDFWCSVKDVHESLDNFLVVGNILLWFDIGGGLLNDFCDRIGQIWNDLSFTIKIHVTPWLLTSNELSDRRVFFFLKRTKRSPKSKFWWPSLRRTSTQYGYKQFRRSSLKSWRKS